MKKDKREIIPKSIVSKLINIIVIAIGNILIIAGEGLISYGRDNINALIEEESERSFLEDDLF